MTDCPNVGTTMEIGGKEKNPVLVAMYMIQHRIGVGRNNFYVDETFVLKVRSKFLFFELLYIVVMT